MSKQTIEDKDQELIQKFRSVIHLKQQQQQSIESRKYGKAAGVVACCIAVLLIVGYLAFNGRVPENLGSSERVAITRPESTAGKLNGKDDTETAPPSKTPEQSAPSVSAESDVNDKAAAPAQSIASPVAPVQTPQSETLIPDINTTFQESAPEPGPSAEGIRIAEIVACKRVENRQPVAPRTVFSLEKDNGPDVWVWMDVRSDKQRLPHTLKHVYYVDGRKYATVALSIAYPRMRTWSNITVKSPDLVGQWRVAVVTDQGETMGQVEFTVIP